MRKYHKHRIPRRGQRFGMLKIVEPVHGPGQQRFTVRCDCGTVKQVYSFNLVRGASRSCGCRSPYHHVHGCFGHPLYQTWYSMKRRCRDRDHKDWRRYGGRGIKVCEQWLDVRAFIFWAERNGWRGGTQLHRKNNDGNYEPGNCEFIPNRVHDELHKRETRVASLKRRIAKLTELLAALEAAS